jgi:hypothetical protein
MAIRYNLVESNTTDIPDNSGAQTFNRGFNIGGGAVDEVIFRFTTVNATNAVLADFGNLVSQLRLVLNGSTVFDYRAGYASSTNNAASQFGYFLNSLTPSRAVEVPGDLAKEAYFRIPVGRNIPAGVSRLEYTLGFAAANAAITSGTCQVWIRYNSAMQTTTTVGNATSFTASGTSENVVVRIPQGIPGSIAGILVQNDSAADEVTSIRIVSQSDFDITDGMLRALNGDLSNGVMYGDDDVSTTAQQYAVSCAGTIFLPTLGLSLEDDVRLTVVTSTSTTLSFTPVITSGITGKAESQGTQTQAVPTNVAQAVLDATAESA